MYASSRKPDMSFVQNSSSKTRLVTTRQVTSMVSRVQFYKVQCYHLTHLITIPLKQKIELEYDIELKLFWKLDRLVINRILKCRLPNSRFLQHSALEWGGYVLATNINDNHDGSADSTVD